VAHSHLCTGPFQISTLAGTSNLGASKPPLLCHSLLFNGYHRTFYPTG